MTMLSQVSRIDPRAVIQQQFQKEAWDPETWKGIILVSAAISVFVLILHFLLYYEKRSNEPRHLNNPQKLFKEMIKGLDVAPAERALLLSMARDLRERSPTALLLSPRRFADATSRWLTGNDRQSAQRLEHLRNIARVLFPKRPVTSRRPAGE